MASNSIDRRIGVMNGKRNTAIFTILALVMVVGIAPAAHAFPSSAPAQLGSSGIVGHGAGPDGSVVFVESINTILPLAYEGYKVVVTGRITSLDTFDDQVDALSYTGRYRPAFPGASIGNYRTNSAGTLGAVVYDQCEPMILSNNHVIANSNEAAVGDAILQPGRFDGGNVDNDTIGLLARWAPVKFCDNENCPTNFVDAAVAKITDSVVDPNPPQKSTSAYVGQPVSMIGRTSELVHGSVEFLKVDVNVEFPGGKWAFFKDQIATTFMAQPGDSGSLLRDTATGDAVGLVFASGANISVANPIGAVLSSLQVSLDGQACKKLFLPLIIR